MAEGFRQAYRLLRRSEQIADVLAAIERNARLLRAVRDALPPPLDTHCHHASCEAGVMTLITDSPVWSTRLRFFAPELARTLASRYGPISTWRFHVRPEASPLPRGAHPPHLSARSARHLIEAAGAIQDSRLALALYRLAQAGARAGRATNGDAQERPRPAPSGSDASAES